jgi:hypothetical protein
MNVIIVPIYRSQIQDEQRKSLETVDLLHIISYLFRESDSDSLTFHPVA